MLLHHDWELHRVFEVSLDKSRQERFPPLATVQQFSCNIIYNWSLQKMSGGGLMSQTAAEWK